MVNYLSRSDYSETTPQLLRHWICTCWWPSIQSKVVVEHHLHSSGLPGWIMSSIKVETILHASNVHVTAFFAQQKLRNGVLVVFVRFAPSSCEMNHWILMHNFICNSNEFLWFLSTKVQNKLPWTLNLWPYRWKLFVDAFCQNSAI